MLNRFIGLYATLFTAPILGFAQSTEPEVPRFYIGLSAFTNNAQQRSRVGEASKWPPLQLTLGYQLRPRLAMQVSAAYNNSPFSFEGMLLDVYGNPHGNYRTDFRSTALSVAALGRYTLTRSRTHRFQVDVLGGFALDQETYESKGYFPDPTTPSVSVPFERNFQASSFALVVGPSVRCRIISGLEAVGEGMLNTSLRYTYPRRVSTSGAVGLRYRFGRS